MAVLVEMSYKHVFDHLGFKYKHFHLKPAFLCFFAFVWVFFFSEKCNNYFLDYIKSHMPYMQKYIYMRKFTLNEIKFANLMT